MTCDPAAAVSARGGIVLVDDTQALGVTGRDLVLAVVMGYETSARVGMASKMRVSVHPHGTVGTIGSAVAVARTTWAERQTRSSTLTVGLFAFQAVWPRAATCRRWASRSARRRGRPPLTPLTHEG